MNLNKNKQCKKGVYFKMKCSNFTNHKKQLISFLIAILISFTFSGCNASNTASEQIANGKDDNTTVKSQAEPEKAPAYKPDPAHGSAVTMEGKAVLVSIFTSDKNTSWNYTDASDKKLIDETLANLTIATDFLSEQVKRFDKKLSFVYDWSKTEHLIYKADFEESLVRYDSDGYKLQREWIEDNIDISALMSKYDADDIIFIFYFNTEASNPITSSALSRINGEQIPLEICSFYLKYIGADMPPASYAHEIMHAYGAKDYYCQGDGVPQKFVDYLKEIESQDIMYCTFDDTEMILNDFTDLDAYYVGIAPRPDLADEWDLGPSEHDKK